MRGAWVEIQNASLEIHLRRSLPVRGAWVEIYCSGGASVCRWTSLPVRGAWVEMVCQRQARLFRLSLPVRGAWVEMLIICYSSFLVLSLPVRGAWVEIVAIRRSIAPGKRRSPCGERGLKFLMDSEKQTFFIVAPRAGSVG